MTDMEKQIMYKMAVKLVQYEIINEDKEAENLVQWFLLMQQMKEGNTEIRGLMKEYKETEHPAREGIKEALKRYQEVCKRREELYHKQNDLKGEIYRVEKELSR